MFPKRSETFIFNLVKELEKRSFLVTICATMISNDNEFYRSDNMTWRNKIIYFNAIKWLLLKNLLKDLRIIQKATIFFLQTYSLKKTYISLKKWYFLNYNKPDIVHFMFSTLATTFHDVIQCNMSSKLVMSCRGPDEFFLTSYENAYSKYLSSVINVIDRIHCVSNEIAGEIIPYGATSKQIFVNYPSVDVNTFNYIKRKNAEDGINKISTYNILSVGRLQPVKGFQYAIFAIYKLKEMGINVKYSIYGSGPEKGFLLYLIKKMNLENTISVYNHLPQNELVEVYKNAHVFLLSSIAEGISNAALEAAATGLPIVSTNLKGMNELFTHKESIFFTKSEDSNDLLDGLLYIYSNPDFAKNIGIGAHKVVINSFSLQSQIDNFVGVYEDLLY